MALLAGTVTLLIGPNDSTPLPPWSGTGLALALFEVDALPYFNGSKGGIVHGLTENEKTNAYAKAANYQLPFTLTDEEKEAAEVEAKAKKVADLTRDLTFFKTRAEAMASAIVNHFAAAADVRIPANAIDPGIPSVERVLAGAVE